MSVDPVERVRYFDGQPLRKQDLVDEQAYHLAMRRRHNAGLHGWGIVHGLELAPAEEEVFLEPGLALDGYGRELVVETRRLLPLHVDRNDLLDVWLLYDRRPAQPVSLQDPCSAAPPEYRWLEEPFLRLTPAVDPVPAARRPPEVPAADNPFPPYRTPPDDPGREWPVFLGRVRRVREKEAVRLEIDPRARPYAGLVGQEVRSPGGGSRLEIGGAGAVPRFAVHAPPVVPMAEEGPPPFEIGGGEITFRGRTRLAGGLRLEGGALELTPAAPSSAAALPLPWQIYLVETAAGERELRVEMGTAGDTPQRVVIGAWSAEKKAFQPILDVAGDRTVTVTGDLIVEGLLLRKPPDEGPPVSPEAERLLLSSFLAGLTAEPPASPLVSAVPAVADVAGAVGMAGGVVGAATDVVQTVVGHIVNLGQDEGALDDLVGRLRQQAPQLLAPLLTRLTGVLGR